nr:hypothetical protein [Tanacetum cinerariifolium]
MVINSPCLTNKKELAIPEQMTTAYTYHCQLKVNAARPKLTTTRVYSAKSIYCNWVSQFNLDLDHQEKVLRMLDVNDEEPAGVEEVLEVVKVAKLITKVVTTAGVDKPIESEGFEQIIDFLNGSSVKYALTLSLTIHTSSIKQFWTSVKVKKVNDEVQIQALVDGKRVNIKEYLIRRILRSDDAEGTSCLTNTEIFKGLPRMGYEKPSDKLTFYKAFLSP